MRKQPATPSAAAVPAALAALAATAALAAPLPAQQRPQERPPAAAQVANAAHPMRIAYDVRVPARDGVRLSLDVFRPDDDRRHPTIFTLTPYNNDSERVMEEAWSFVRRGYAYVAADVRGRYDSEGEFVPFRNDGRDGSDLMAWIAAQPWSDGKVATIGGSYLGKVQWLMAKEASPHHAAIVSYVAPADEFMDGVRYNGVPKVDLMYTWLMSMDGRVNQSRGGWDWGAAMTGLPLTTLDERVGRRVEVWRDWMEHDRLDDYWSPVQMTGSYERFRIPSFNVTGWYEGQLKGQVQNYVNAVRVGGDASRHVLVIGPWLHGVNDPSRRVIGERDHGPQHVIDLDGMRDRWLDHHLRGAPRPDLPNVLYFLPVRNEWRRADAWPIPGTVFTAYHLDSGGRANTLAGDGVLRPGVPGSGRADEFVYDPANPVRSVSSRTSGARGGLRQGPVDHRAVETRPDVLVYTSEPLAEGMEVTGPVKATIHISTDVPDTDITVRLLDVHPDGRALNVTEGIARAKYRDSFAEPKPLEPGEVYGIEVELFPTSNHFRAGHRIRVEVSSSDFPNFARNLNTMDSDRGTAMRVARTRVHHTRAYPSAIVLPVVPPGAARPVAEGR